MARYIFQRLLQSVIVIWAAFTLSFVLLQLIPGDAGLIRFLDGNFGLTPEQLAEVRAYYGVDVPVWRQYFGTLRDFLTGNFGYSVVSGTPVLEEILTNTPSTLLLAGLSFTLAVLLALTVAFLATLPRADWLRELVHTLPPLLVSVPVFWLAIMLIQIFSFQLGWISIIAPRPWERLILPTVAIAVPISAPLAQILIRNIDALATQGFVPVARAKGATRSFVILRHVLPNALLPTLTIAGVLFGGLVAGAVVTETVFALSGLGRLAERSVRMQDAAMLQVIVVMAAVGFVVVNLVVDLLYPVLDPRLRSERRARA